MSEVDREDLVRTRVARAIDGENLFFGYRVSEELAGHDDFWSVYSLAIGHRRLSPDESGLLGDINTCNMVADPRIHPLKLARLVASWGGAFAGYAAGLLVLERSQIGPAATEHAARVLLRFAAELNGAEPTEEALDQALDRTPYHTGVVPGFGVPFRGEDERLPAAHRCLRARGRDHLPFVRLHGAITRLLARRRGLAPNIAGIASAAWLDMGFSPDQCRLVGVPFSVCHFMANTAEGAEQQHRGLQSLPLGAIQYVGAPARETRRASRST